MRSNKNKEDKDMLETAVKENDEAVTSDNGEKRKRRPASHTKKTEKTDKAEKTEKKDIFLSLKLKVCGLLFRGCLWWRGARSDRRHGGRPF